LQWICSADHLCSFPCWWSKCPNDDILAKLWIYLQMKLLCHSYSDRAFTVLFCCIGVVVRYYQPTHQIFVHIMAAAICVFFGACCIFYFFMFSIVLWLNDFGSLLIILRILRFISWFRSLHKLLNFLKSLTYMIDSTFLGHMSSF
jgi:hypothetical protein